jgi:hypothetical protein
MGINYSPKIVTDGLVLCLDAGNTLSYPGSGNVWNDLSGNGNNGTLVNSSFSNQNKGSLYLNGSNTYISFNKNVSDFNIQSNATLSLWANVSLAGAWRGFFGFASTSGFSGNAANFSVDFVSGTNQLRVWKNNTAFYANTIPTTNTWYYYTIASSATGFFCYINDFAAGAAFTTGNITVAQSLIIGDNWDPNVQAYIGQCHMYNKTLSEQEIQQNYNALKGRFGL